MIYITCDIHHQSLQTENQKHSDRRELECAHNFFKLLEQYNINATYFISGKVFQQEWGHELEEISSSSNIELGGHNWDCFENEFLHRVCNKLLNSYNGSYGMQKRDCLRTKEIIERLSKKKVSSWRNHMYMHGKYTERVLSECGITVCSDGVKKENFAPIKSEYGVSNLPINIIPDHEHIYHAERTPEWVEKWVERYNWRDDFGSESYDIDSWGEIFLNQLKLNIINGKKSIILLHPITMYLADNYKFVEKLFRYIEGQPTGFIRDFSEVR